MMFLGRGYEFFGHCFSPEYGIGRGVNGFWPMHGYVGFLGIIAVLLIGILVFVIISKRKKSENVEKIIESLNYKYVNGDITEEEYIRKKELLLKK